MSNSDFNVEELAKGHSQQIDLLKDKMDRCYSIDRYKDFQSAVLEIVDEQIKIKWIYSLFTSIIIPIVISGIVLWIEYTLRK